MDPESFIAINDEKSTGLGLEDKNKSKKKWIIVTIILAIVVVIVACVVGVFMWYQNQLQPVDANNTKEQVVVVEQGEATVAVAKTLYDNELIHSERIFMLYARLHDFTAQAGAYMIAPSKDLPAIAKKLSTGDTDSYDLNISPGLSVGDIKEALVESGFDARAVEKAFEAEYDIDILASRPQGASLEGFVMGFAQKFSVNSTPKDIVRAGILGLERYVKENNLEKAYEEHGLTVYEGIILASIIQKEVAQPDDMAHVSQVFHSRLKQDMPLGSDPTFIYGAKLMGVQPATDLDSPYNTRIHKGLPPTPIASPSSDALYAVAHPSDTDDLFFVAGDDGKTRFSKTNAEHERLTRKYCHTNCILPSN